MKEKIGVALIGAGRIEQEHAKGPQEKSLAWSVAEPRVFQIRQPSAESVAEGRFRDFASSLQSAALQS